jgi:hypothetical protein
MPIIACTPLRGRVGDGAGKTIALAADSIGPHPPRSDERVDLPRKRER